MMYTSRNNNNDINPDNTIIPLMDGKTGNMLNPFSFLFFRNIALCNQMSNARRLTEELVQAVEVLKAKCFMIKAVRTETEGPVMVQENSETTTPLKAQGIIYHLKHTKNSIAKNRADERDGEEPLIFKQY